MYVGTRKMVNYAWIGWSQRKLWWRLVAILTCKSIVEFGYRGERLIEPLNKMGGGWNLSESITRKWSLGQVWPTLLLATWNYHVLFSKYGIELQSITLTHALWINLVVLEFEFYWFSYSRKFTYPLSYWWLIGGWKAYLVRVEDCDTVKLRGLP